MVAIKKTIYCGIRDSGLLTLATIALGQVTHPMQDYELLAVSFLYQSPMLVDRALEAIQFSRLNVFDRHHLIEQS
jgi:hypothetical protein